MYKKPGASSPTQARPWKTERHTTPHRGSCKFLQVGACYLLVLLVQSQLQAAQDPQLAAKFNWLPRFRKVLLRILLCDFSLLPYLCLLGLSML